MERDDAGLLWIYIRKPRPGWQTAWPSGLGRVAEVRATPELIGRLYDTLVEVIDPRTARVVARRILDEHVVLSLLPGRRVAAIARGTSPAKLGVLQLSVSSNR
jgi:hypothetical protein